MSNPDLNLSVPSLMAACKGNVSMLPSFMVHDNDVWPRSAVIRTDSKGRIHMRRAAFEAVVMGQLPLRAGLWQRVDVQEFFIALEAHHLGGGSDQVGGDRMGAARGVAMADKAGRLAGDQGYGEALRGDHRKQDIARDVREAKEAGTSGSVGSNVFTGVRSE